MNKNRFLNVRNENKDLKSNLMIMHNGICFGYFGYEGVELAFKIWYNKHFQRRTINRVIANPKPYEGLLW